ncbi:Holliday junction resolvase RuvX [bacterium]|nr:Holliday junction resolvase RuvX [bacterium]
MKTILAVDPGRSKCGVAVVRAAVELPRSVDILHKSVIESARLGEIVIDLRRRYDPDVIIIGNGTTSAQAAKAVSEVDSCPVEMVDEKYTSLLARKRFLKDNPPRGLKKLIPISLQTPDRPCDDYVAVILAERYIEGFTH